MPRPRMKIVRNPAHPRESVISGKSGGGKNGLDLIDLGAPPIPRYGVVYITTLEAIVVAETIGWVDGELVREKFNELEAENRKLRAMVAGLPLLIHETSEKYRDGLNTLAGDLVAAFDTATDALPVADPAERPSWASAERATVELGDSGRNAKLDRVDDGDSDPASEDLGGQPVSSDRADDGNERIDAVAAESSEPDAGDGTSERVESSAAIDPASDAADVGGAKSFRITDVYVGDDDSDAGDA